VFYDVTTLYFETDYSDELREKGFSKYGKHSQPQVVLGLLVSREGYPLSYSLFNGSQYEGYTMIPVVEDFVQRIDYLFLHQPPYVGLARRSDHRWRFIADLLDKAPIDADRINSLLLRTKIFQQFLLQSKNFCTFAADYQKTTVNTSQNNSTFQSNENFSRENAKFLLENLAVSGILLERERER
jgi:hypothetical protein